MQLFFYESYFDGMIERYYLSEEQRQFTSSPREAIALFKHDPTQIPILAIEKNHLVSFFVLHEYQHHETHLPPSLTTTLILKRFSTDHHHRGKGYSQRVLAMLPDYLNEYYPEITEIIGQVNVANTVLQELYRQSGFVDTGKREQSELGEIIIMRRKL